MLPGPQVDVWKSYPPSLRVRPRLNTECLQTSTRSAAALNPAGPVPSGGGKHLHVGETEARDSWGPPKLQGMEEAERSLPGASGRRGSTWGFQPPGLGGNSLRLFKSRPESAAFDTAATGQSQGPGRQVPGSEGEGHSLGHRASCWGTHGAARPGSLWAMSAPRCALSSLPAPQPTDVSSAICRAAGLWGPGTWGGK